MQYLKFNGNDKDNFYKVAIGLLGGTLGIGSVALITQWQGVPLLIAPFGASCVLLFAVPESPLAQPRNVVGGHLIASLVGIIFSLYIGNSPLWMGLSVGLAIALMQLTHTLHAPAGANPILILMSGTVGWSFLVMPILLGSLILVVIALIINNLRGGQRRWPLYW